MPSTLADLPMLVTPKQAAAVMGPTESQVRALIRDGRLIGIRNEAGVRVVPAGMLQDGAVVKSLPAVITLLRERGVTLPGPRFGLVAALGLAGLLTGLWRNVPARWVAAAVLLHMAALLSVFITDLRPRPRHTIPRSGRSTPTTSVSRSSRSRSASKRKAARRRRWRRTTRRPGRNSRMRTFT